MNECSLPFDRLASLGRIKDTLEDRAESLILATDDQVAEVLPRLINHFSQQDQVVSDWRRKLETLQ